MYYLLSVQDGVKIVLRDVWRDVSRVLWTDREEMVEVTDSSPGLKSAALHGKHQCKHFSRFLSRYIINQVHQNISFHPTERGRCVVGKESYGETALSQNRKTNIYYYFPHLMADISSQYQ